jgi:hypothetical protein
MAKATSKEERARILQWMEDNGATLGATARKFGRAHSSIKRWAEEAKLQKQQAADEEAARVAAENAKAWEDYGVEHWQHATSTTLRDKPKAEKILEVFAVQAGRVVADLEPGGRIVGISAGQFSMLDLIMACLDKTGPADLMVATWMTGAREIETGGWLLTEERIRSLRLIVDSKFATLRPAYAARMMELYGANVILPARIHAKFCTIRNEDWSICIRASMNFNTNNQLEQFDIDDHPGICDLFDGVAKEIGRRAKVLGWKPNTDAAASAVWDKIRDTAKAREAMLARERRRQQRLQQPKAENVVEELAEMIDSLQEDIEGARVAERWSAIPNLVGQQRQLRADLAEAQAVASAPPLPELPGDKADPLTLARHEFRMADALVRRAQLKPKIDTQGLAGLMRLLERARAAYSAQLAARHDGVEDMTPDQQRESLRSLAEALPDQLLDVFVEEYKRRHKIERMLAVREGGVTREVGEAG